MKASEKPEPSPFERFAKTLKAIVAVPKSEVDQIIAEEKAKRRAKRKRQHSEQA
jgi:hypothetical protein